MTRTAYVYVPRNSAHNLEIGLTRRVWGWEDDALSKADGKEMAGSLEPGDSVVFGHRGPNSRVQPGGWKDVRLDKVVFAKVARSLYRSDEWVWPDRPYLWRIDLEYVGEEEQVHGLALGEVGMESLRLSANKQGTPVVASAPDGYENVVAAAPEVDEEDAFRFDGPVDGKRLMAYRREQRRLKQLKFGEATEVTCDLCGRVLPRRFVRAAHIKRRADCAYPEQLKPENIMAACALGCDEVFEHGYIYVDDEGKIRPGPRCDVFPAVADFVKLTFADRACGAYGAKSKPFFEYHRGQALAD
ncbi:hypothetical protein [Kutzneria sp. NPDC052558]|uniref:hypothetical protein n=1 Tax=Kutzneria sp. NPDC052558 TaxID=3364121 RepID=UPI0037C71D6E